MRVICGDYAMVVKTAECVGKQLVFQDLDDVFYHTDNYFGENIAHCALNDLVVNGYIRVKTLHGKERNEHGFTPRTFNLR